MSAIRQRGADRIPRRWRVLAGWTVLAVCAFGCERESSKARYRTYVPSSVEASKALEESLSAWHDASPPLPDSFGTRTARFVDNQHRPQQRLLRFQILAEKDTGSSRLYTVRLMLDNPEETQLARYYVFGRNPCWVFRQEDLEMMLHWEHGEHAPAR
jgi:hypothetical protein